MANIFLITKTLNRSQLIKESEIKAYLEWGKKNKVISFCEHNISSIDESSKVSQLARVSRIESLLNCVRRLQLDAEKYGYSLILVENASVIQRFNLNRGCFDSGDFDMMAAKKYGAMTKLEIEMIFAESGWKLSTRRPSDELLMYSFSNPAHDQVFHINVELNSVSRGYFKEKSKTNYRIQQFLRHSILEVDGIKLFRDEENFYLNLLHISIGHYYGTSPGIRLYYDLHPYLKAGSIDFQKILDWATKDGTLLRVLCALKCYETLFENDVSALLENGFMYANLQEQHSDEVNKIMRLVPLTTMDHSTLKFSLLKQIAIDARSSQQSFLVNFFKRFAIKFYKYRVPPIL